MPRETDPTLISYLTNLLTLTEALFCQEVFWISTISSRSPVQWFHSGARAAQRAAKQSPILIWERKGNPWMDFRMVFMASGIARGHMRTTMMMTTTAAELPNKVAILQLISWQRHAPSVCSGIMPSFLGGIFKERKTQFYLLCQHTIVEVDLIFLR